MAAPKRVVFSIDADILARFDRLYSPKKRSEIVQRLMVQAMEANAAEVADAAIAAMKIATDPSYREYDIISDWADAQAIDTLSRF
jgi:metal-responsive CopG/Arc/MetJ family transcriptional regulator